jgi:predicted house-cleaning NTP pyrophosphatase (Maf/HAM1 superfamily)
METKATFVNETLMKRGIKNKAKMIVGDMHDDILGLSQISREEKIDFIKTFFEDVKEIIVIFYNRELKENEAYLKADDGQKKQMKEELEQKIKIAIKEIEGYLFKVKGLELDEKTGKYVHVVYDILTGERSIIND